VSCRRRIAMLPLRGARKVLVCSIVGMLIKSLRLFKSTNG
jgi:hypothetical protein